MMGVGGHAMLSPLVIWATSCNPIWLVIHMLEGLPHLESRDVRDVSAFRLDGHGKMVDSQRRKQEPLDLLPVTYGVLLAPKYVPQFCANKK